MPRAQAEEVLDSYGYDYDHGPDGRLDVHLERMEVLPGVTVGRLRRAGYEVNSVHLRPWGARVVLVRGAAGSPGVSL